MNTFLLDLRQSFRSLWKSPGFLVAAVLSLALGVGTNAAVFSTLRAGFFKSLPWAEPERLVFIGRKDAQYPNLPDQLDVTWRSAQLWRESQHVLESLSVFARTEATLRGPVEPRTILGGRMESNFFQTLGAKPYCGRLFAKGDVSGAVLSYRFWKTAFQEDPSVVGKAVSIAGKPMSILGVLPPEASFLGCEVFWPLVPTPDEQAQNSSWLLLVGRLRSGTTLPAAQRELVSMSRSLEQTHGTERGITAVAKSLREAFYGRRTAGLQLLALVAAFILALSCLNVAALMLGRATARNGELGLREALGARRSQIFLPLLAESLLAAVPGLVLGLLFALWTQGLLSSFLAIDLRTMQGMGWVELGFASLVALLVATFSALFPALVLPRLNLSSVLQGAKSTGSPKRRGLRHGLISLQVACALALLSGFFLLTSSLNRLKRADLGIRPEGRVVANLKLPAGDKETVERYTREMGVLLERIRALPGVQCAGTTDLLPCVSDGGSNGNIQIPGLEKPVFTYGRLASTGYFQAAGIPLLKGRDFTNSDMNPDSTAVIISDSFARSYFPGQDPIGRRIGDGGAPSEIVGVVGDARLDMIRQTTDLQAVYSPALLGNSFCDVVVKVQGDPRSQISSVRQIIRNQWPEVALDKMDTLSALLEQQNHQESQSAVLMGILAALALLLSVVGLYGVLNRDVMERRREIGIRMALGSAPSAVLRLLVSQGLAVVGTGVILGSAGCVAMAILLRAQLYEVGAMDPMVHLAAVLTLTASALAACAIPALRAALIQPSVALRNE